MRTIPRATPIYNTEYGVQTDPPDQFFGMSLTRQADYINEADYMSWRDRRIRSVSQYNLVDDADTRGFNTGLIFNPNTRDGAEKPSLAAYRTPIFVINHGSTVDVWGQTRPGGPNQKVDIQTGSADTFVHDHRERWPRRRFHQTWCAASLYNSSCTQRGCRADP